MLHDDPLQQDLAHHDDHQLDGQFDEAATNVAFLLLVAQKCFVRFRRVWKLA